MGSAGNVSPFPIFQRPSADTHTKVLYYLCFLRCFRNFCNPMCKKMEMELRFRREFQFLDLFEACFRYVYKENTPLPKPCKVHKVL